MIFLLFFVSFQLFLLNTHLNTNLNDEIERSVELYLKPFPIITKEMMDNSIRHAFSKHHSRNTTVLFQYIDGKLHCDTSLFHSMHLWDQQRLQFIKNTLHTLLSYRHFDRDFELVYNTHDCPVRKLFHNQDSLLGPIFGNLRCPRAHAAVIPFPQWYYRRDGSFGNMTWPVNEHWRETWHSRKPVAAHRGFYRSTCLTPQLHFVNLNATNPFACGRGALLNQPSAFVDVALFSDIPEHSRILPPGIPMPMEQQARTYKYVIYAEGNCGWADRLKILLSLGMLIFLQDTPCHEWYQAHMHPWKHYVPVANDWSNLVERIEWARKHDIEAQLIVQNASDLGKALMNPTIWQDYLYELLFEYSQRLNYKITKRF